MITGRYRYTLDGSAVPVDETFVVHAEGVDAHVESVREAGEVRLEACARWTDGTPRTLVRWSSPDAQREVVMEELAAGTSLPGASGNDAPAAGGPLVPFALLRVFAGPVLLAVADATVVGADGTVSGGRRVLVPDIRDPGEVDRLLRPLVDVRTAVDVPAQDLDDGARRLAYRGGSYAEAGAAFDVDVDGLLLGYRWDQPGVGAWHVELADLQGGRPRPCTWGRPGA